MPNLPTTSPTKKLLYRKRIYLSLGSNIGDRKEMLEKAIQKLKENPNIFIEKVSSTLDNPPLLYEKQDNFLNQVLCIQSNLSPLDLLDFIKKIEKDLGRLTRFRYGPREIDIDILSYGKEKIKEENIEIPHPALASRKYLVPLLKEIGSNPKKLLGK